ncbi:MAG: hypothetical protein IJH67_04945 [Thermoguttaceae bacterium]|nr:hypothetical protein [Thermoguttaceae bacterium]
MKIINTQQSVDGALIQRVTLLAEGIKQDRLEEAVAEGERRFLEQHGNGLFVDVPARVDLVNRWAAMMDSRHGTKEYSQMLVSNIYFATGRYFGYHVVLFPKLDADGLPAGFTAYRLTGDRFGATAKWFDAPERIVLNDLGEMVPTAKPLPLGGTDNPTPEALRQWKREWRELWKYKDAHNGRTPEQEAKYQERRKRRRGKN